MSCYQQVVFQQGDEAREALAILEGTDDGIPDQDTMSAAVEYLRQWQDAENEVLDHSTTMPFDQQYQQGDLLLSWNTDFPYVSLEMAVQVCTACGGSGWLDRRDAPADCHHCSGFGYCALKTAAVV